MIKNIQNFINKPKLYASSTARFWDDEHISKGMLKAHLTPGSDSATRNHKFVRQSVDWISSIAPAETYPRLLDLGCGPGIYTELFDAAGYQVTGVDLSDRSIEYAKASAKAGNKQITYLAGDYLTLKYSRQFDAATLIYCDFGALSTENRSTLLSNAALALRPGGLLIFDVFTPLQYSGKDEYRTWEYLENGFWSADPHLCLSSLYRYDDSNTFLTQYIVVTEDNINCYNIWEHTFTKNELIQDLSIAGFRIQGICNDIAGNSGSPDGTQMCIVAERQ